MHAHAVAERKADGEPDGNVPTKLKLKPGRHILDVSADGFTSRQVPVDAQPDVTRQVSVSLRPLPPPTGKLVVTANHDGALVKVDGKWLVASILWQEATPDNPLPANLIKGKK